MKPIVYKESQIFKAPINLSLIIFVVLLAMVTVHIPILFIGSILILIILIAYIYISNKKLILTEDELIIKSYRKTKKIKWENIVGMASPTRVIFVYSIQTKDGSRYYLPYLSKWKEFEKDFLSKTNLKLTAEGWYPRMGLPKDKRWSSSPNDQMKIDIHEGHDLYFNPNFILSKLNMKDGLVVIIIIAVWTIIALFFLYYK